MLIRDQRYIGVILPDGFLVPRVEVAWTSAQMRQGLAGRSEVGADSGMLFLFGNAGQCPICMDGCLVPLDILWLDRDYCVRRVVRAFPFPGQGGVDPGGQSLYVLELAVGQATLHAAVTQGARLKFVTAAGGGIKPVTEML